MASRSTVNEYLKLLHYEVVPERLAAWVDLYEAAHPEVFSVYYSAWGDRSRREEAASAVEVQAALVRRREAEMTRTVRVMGERLRHLGLIDDEIPLVMLVGGRSANGWVASYEGAPTLFIALEYLDDSAGDDVLVAHEASHIVHARLNPAFETGTLTGRLVAEGIAVLLSRLLVPEASDSEFFWFDGAHNEWVEDCRAAQHLISAFVREARPGSSSDHESLFNLRPSGGIPPRAGYWLAEQMLREHDATAASIREVMMWTDDEAELHADGALMRLFEGWEESVD
jgi:hypothetical protein